MAAVNSVFSLFLRVGFDTKKHSLALLLGRLMGDLKKLSNGSETWHMTSEDLGKMFECDFSRYVCKQISAQVNGG